MKQGRARKAALTAHITASAGWFGAVAAFLGLALLGALSTEAGVRRAAYLVMAPAGWAILVPFAIASLLTGLIVSVGKPWGLLRYYWVAFKLVINSVAIGVLLLYMQTLRALANSASAGETIGGKPAASPAIHSALALLLLAAATVLAVYKPHGRIRFRIGTPRAHISPPNLG